MARTNIDIDDELIARAMARYRLSTKREAVDFALRRLVGNPMTREQALAMEGTGWDGDLDAMRSGEPVPGLREPQRSTAR
jgi:Arc/MetJ family transcription regulator